MSIDFNDDGEIGEGGEGGEGGGIGNEEDHDDEMFLNFESDDKEEEILKNQMDHVTMDEKTKRQRKRT